MNNLTNSFLDYLTPKERNFYNAYSSDKPAGLTEAQRKMMRCIIKKKIQWRRDKAFVYVSASGVAKTAGVNGIEEYKHIRDKLYEAWVWGQTH